MKRVVVLDCSATSPWFIPDEHSGCADRILADSTSGRTMMLVAGLWWYETANVLAAWVRRHRLDQEQAQVGNAAACTGGSIYIPETGRREGFPLQGGNLYICVRSASGGFADRRVSPDVTARGSKYNHRWMLPTRVRLRGLWLSAADGHISVDSEFAR